MDIISFLGQTVAPVNQSLILEELDFRYSAALANEEKYKRSVLLKIVNNFIGTENFNTVLTLLIFPERVVILRFDALLSLLSVFI